MRALTRPAGARSGTSRAMPAILRRSWWLACSVSVLGLIGVAARSGGDDSVAVQATDTTAVESDARDGNGQSPGRSATTATTVVNPAAATSAGGPATSAANSTSTTGPATTSPVATATTTSPGATATTAPAATTPPPASPGRPAPGTAACADAPGDRTTESMTDIDLLGTSLSLDTNALHVVFQLAGPPPPTAANRPPSAGDAGGAATTSWGVFLSTGNETLFGITVQREGDTWSTSLINFRSDSGDRDYAQPPVNAATIEIVVPDADLVGLPASFNWWAWTDTDRTVPSVGDYLGDDCPNGSSETAGTTSNVARFPG